MRPIARSFAAASIVLLAAALAQAGELSSLHPPVGQLELDVAEPEPPVAPTPVSLAYALDGTATYRVPGEKKIVEPFSAELAYDLTEQTFYLMTGDGVSYTGHLSPKGTSGRKFTLFLDADSHETLRNVVGKEAGRRVGRAVLLVVGDSTKLVMTLDEEGAPTLKIKTQVLTTGLGEVVFKALFAPIEEHS